MDENKSTSNRKLEPNAKNTYVDTDGIRKWFCNGREVKDYPLPDVKHTFIDLKDNILKYNGTNTPVEDVIGKHPFIELTKDILSNNKISFSRLDSLVKDLYSDNTKSFASATVSSTGGHNTQISSTEATYDKIGNVLLNNPNYENLTILDASSGKGIGTENLRKKGLNVDDVEPYASSTRKAPTFDDYAKVPKNHYDVVISNAVLNVLPEVDRENILSQLADVTKPEGKIIVNTRGKTELNGSKGNKNYFALNSDGSEQLNLSSVKTDKKTKSSVINLDKATFKSFQKGFTSKELQDWADKVLNSDKNSKYTYEIRNTSAKEDGIPHSGAEGRMTIIKHAKKNSFMTPEKSKAIEKAKAKKKSNNNITEELKKTYGIKRHQNNVGKSIGGQIYLHKNYATDVIPKKDFEYAKNKLPKGFDYNCICYDKKKNTIRFDSAPDFDSAREPIPGNYIKVDLNNNTVSYGGSKAIWHHKWLWVKDDYKGFDVQKSKEWSHKWKTNMPDIKTSTIGKKENWENELKKHNLPIDK